LLVHAVTHPCYAVIVTERINRTTIALFGAAVLLLIRALGQNAPASPSVFSPSFMLGAFPLVEHRDQPFLHRVALYHT